MTHGKSGKTVEEKRNGHRIFSARQFLQNEKDNVNFFSPEGRL
jgi:hypothetical protein